MPSGRHAVVGALVLVLLVAGGLRAAGAAGVPPSPRSADERSYAVLAADLAADGSYGRTMRRPFHWPPGAPAVFAAAQRVLPGTPAQGARAAQLLAGVLLVLATATAGAFLAGAWAGVAAAAVVALDPTFAGATPTWLSEPLGALWLMSATALTLWALRGHAWAWWAAGAAWGATVLTRADFLLAPLAVAALLLLVGRARHDGRLIRGGVALVAAAGLLVLPWCVVASTRSGAPVPVTTGGGAALFVGTFLPGGGTTLGAKRALAGDIVARDPGQVGRPASRLSAMTLMDVVAERHPALPREAALEREARVNLARYPLGDPVGYAAMTLDKLRRMWLSPSRLGAFGAPGWLRVVHGPLVLLAAALALLALRRRRDFGLAVVLLPVAYATAMHSITVANPRYALVPLPLLVVAGAAAASLLRRTAPAVAPSRSSASTR